MSVQAVVLPLLVQVALTFALLLRTGYLRVRALRRGETRVAEVALGQLAWPARVQQVGNCYNNQFQLPVLFYVLTGLALALRQADLLFVVLAWLFVATRLVHAWIFTTTNNITHRFYAFVAGVLVLLAMWLIFAVRILAGT